MAVLDLVYPGAVPSAVASAAVDAQLDGLVLEGEFPGGPRFAEQLEKTLRTTNSSAVVIPVEPAALLRKAAWPVLAAALSSRATRSGEALCPDPKFLSRDLNYPLNIAELGGGAAWSEPQK